MNRRPPPLSYGGECNIVCSCHINNNVMLGKMDLLLQSWCPLLKKQWELYCVVYFLVDSFDTFLCTSFYTSIFVNAAFIGNIIFVSFPPVNNDIVTVDPLFHFIFKLNCSSYNAAVSSTVLHLTFAPNPTQCLQLLKGQSVNCCDVVVSVWGHQRDQLSGGNTGRRIRPEPANKSKANLKGRQAQ